MNLIEYLSNTGWVICGIILYPLTQWLMQLYKDMKDDYEYIDALESENEYLKEELKKSKEKN